jgi:hypothetical protein
MGVCWCIAGGQDTTYKRLVYGQVCSVEAGVQCELPALSSLAGYMMSFPPFSAALFPAAAIFHLNRRTYAHSVLLLSELQVPVRGRGVA